MRRIAAFITPHGYGHATRTIAILEALQHRIPNLAIDIFTTVPKSLFTASLNHVHYHPVAGDVGVIQSDALTIDVAATLQALDTLLPYPEQMLAEVTQKVNGCSLILADIAPLGIVIARRCDIPSVLVENFTWDWIYQPYLQASPSLGRHIDYFSKIYADATLHIQAEPLCRQSPHGLACPPVFRKRRMDSATLRHQLGVGKKRLVVISMGGIDLQLQGWQQLRSHCDCFFILAGQHTTEQLLPNCISLARTTAIHHPDLIGCADLVVTKSGYSTLMECLQGGTPPLCITRPQFQESLVLEKFVVDRLKGRLISEADFLSGKWLSTLPELMDIPRPEPATVNGADIAAQRILGLYS